MISVIIPLFNKENLILRTLHTVLNQTFQRFEIIIVNDGSTDKSIAEVNKIKDERIRIINQVNSGVSAARNRGIQEAKYELIAFLDADDEWKEDYLQTQYELYLKYPECSVFSTTYLFQKTNGRRTPPLIQHIPFEGICGILSTYFKVSAVSDPPLWTSAVMVLKSAIQTIGGFPLRVKSGEDLLTWARLACRYNIAYTIKPMAIYYQGYSNPRPPESKDYVGEQLEILYKSYPDKIGLKKYVAFWYKMRMCRCLAHKMWKNALTALYKSLRYNPFQGKIYLSIVKYTLIGLK